ncbi:hypothetical protein PsYK624_143920 [Phanerochaete sordida]|uniref:Uncharacterized protein n=1 Tax=Phanerochaete sordida TaxID=48140 RepID=A0A9P3LKB3_9APHY|nr:hypothetical protein PsYK624_143920 [Phanerochaete sordida]
MRHTNQLSIYLRDGWPVAAPQPVSASTRLTHDSGYAGTARTDTLGLEHAGPSRSPLVARLEEHADAQAAAEAQYAARMLSVHDPPRSRVNARLRRLSPPAITLRPRTPPPTRAMLATFTDNHERDDVSIMNYPPATARPRGEPAQEQGLLLLNAPVIPGVNVPAPPFLRDLPPVRRASQTWAQAQEPVRGWVQTHAAPPAAGQVHSPQEPPPLVHRCAELPPLTAPPPYEYEDPEMEEDTSSVDALATIRSRWPFAPPTLTSQAETAAPAQTLHTNTQLATPEISSVGRPPAPDAPSSADVPMAVDSPADEGALSSLQLRFERPPYEEWEELATRCARAVGDMRWVLSSCKELALHETNAVTKALVGAVLAVRDAFADAPDDMSVLEQEGCHEWGVKYELLLVSCCRNIDLLTLQAEHVRDRPPRIHKLSGLLDKLWRYVEKFEDLERKLRIVHDHIRVLDLHSRLQHSREHAAADASAERARRRAFSDVQNQARDRRREVRSEVRRLREETRARRDVRIERKLSRAEALGEACAV